MYGDRIERVVLYGSHACGDARPDSDYDVAVFLKQFPDRCAELDRLAGLRAKFLAETGAFFDAKPYAATAYRERSPLVHEFAWTELIWTPETHRFLQKAEKHIESKQAHGHALGHSGQSTQRASI